MDTHVPYHSPYNTWGQRIRLVKDFGNGVQVWTVAMYSADPQDGYKYKRSGTFIGVFMDQRLMDAVTDYDYTINSLIYRMAIGCAKRIARGDV